MTSPLLLSLFLSAAPLAAPAAGGPLAEVEALYGEGEFEQALKKADAALARTKSPAEAAKLLLAKGLCHLAIGSPDKARAAFTAALKKDVSAELDASRVAPDALELFEKARAEFPATVSITVAGGGSIRVDDKPLGPAPLTTQLPAGRHVFEAVGADGRRARSEHVLRAGAKTTVALDLGAAAPVTVKPEVKPVVTPTPPVEPKPAPELVAKAPPVEVKPEVPPEPPLVPLENVTTTPPSSGLGRRLAFGLIPVALGLGAGIGGAVALGDAQTKYDALANSTQTFLPSTREDLVASGKGLQTVGWLGLGLGAAAVTTGVILFFATAPRDEAPAVSAIITPAGEAFVSVGGRLP